MKISVTRIGVTMMVLWSCAAAAQVPHVLGLWKLNIEASSLPESAFPAGIASEIRSYRQRDDGYLVVLATRVYGDGTPEFVQVTIKSDGKDYPQYQSGVLAEFQANGAKTPFTYSETIVDEFGAQIIARRNGMQINKGTRRISRDGKTMTLTVTALSADRKEMPIVLVFDRAPSPSREPAQSQTDIEAANERLVRAFLAQASVDLRHYRAFLSDNVIYQYEGSRIEGQSALIDKALGKMSPVRTYVAEPGRISVVGNTVLNDRVDVFTMKDGEQVRLRVASVFLVAKGKIAEWREYPQP